jgi:hypothetical protein
MSPFLWAAGGGPIVSFYINSPVKSNFFSVQGKYAGFRVNRIWTAAGTIFWKCRLLGDGILFGIAPKTAI